MQKLLSAFQQFFREHSDAWIEGFSFKEAGPQLLMQAFLQRIVNGGGRINREYGLGRKRTDLFIEWPIDETQGYFGPVQRVVLELKLWKKGSLEAVLADGLPQTVDYARQCGADEAHLIVFDQPRRGNAGRSTEAVTLEPVFDEEEWFNRFRVGIYPDYFEGVQFSRDREALNQYFRQMTPTIGPLDFDVYSDAYAALFDKIGPAIFVTHSQGGPVGWFTLLKTKNIKAIVAYEPGGSVPFPTGQVPEEGKVLTRSKKTEGIEVPMAVFKRYMEIPIIIYYGDNLPETDEHPELYEWTRRLHLMRKWAEMLNKLGGDVTVIHLPDVGLHGNTHFPMSDLNNVEVADLLSKWLYEKQLDR
jgi:pimeloyl-ACP methyl ester carboxylesterase